jgi:lipid-binding SYLF domain-containing protein
MRKLIGILACLTTCAGALAVQTTKEAERLQSAATIVNEIMRTPDKAIPQDLLDKAVCVGVIPSEKKFALGVGGSFGRGALVCRRGRNGRWGRLPCSQWAAGASGSNWAVRPRILYSS